MNCWKIFKLIKYFKNYADFKKKDNSDNLVKRN